MDSEFIRHEPCQNCGSSDANSIYSDGHQYCFACNTYIAGDTEHTHQMQTNVNFKGSAQRLQKRGISEKYANFTKSTETMHTYASLISMAQDVLKDSN